ncbi:hypothetical protein HGP17_07330 [Rhizobium sp. P38BS-XIX]|uniref:hypothetical protein n=1 Tax=Rhizobium sp. P38BS-XIX TaxID=2726740 RepID=UPI001456CEAF|nr:hypothetical protein [Rhizobium sp. P38BS-XIX]NLR96643.1 hypothetical protein [Rhizobium sp. P38BS-XIX]
MIEKTAALALPENGEAFPVEPSCAAKEPSRMIGRQETTEKKARSQAHEHMGAPKQNQHGQQTGAILQAHHSRLGILLRTSKTERLGTTPVSIALAAGLQEAAAFFIVSGHHDPSRSHAGCASADRHNDDLRELMR